MIEIIQNEKGLSQNDNLIGYDWGDAIRHNNPNDHLTYKNLAKTIVDKCAWGTESILELGCGSGNLSSWIKESNSNINYYTCDINRDIINNGLINDENHFIIRTDKPFMITKDKQNFFKFDLILSFEHFEHIESDKIDILLSNIKNHSNKNTIIIATASTIYRDCHPTIWSREEWISKLNNLGFEIIDGHIILTPENKPMNFELANTSELIFKLK
jgi:2-polyprenyl-3-methyl-5-hydroxy-6-metoxy-1,4-benzoquinol methylase